MKRWVRAIPWLLVCAAMIISLIRLEGVVNQISAEKNRAIYAECLVLKEAIKPLHDVIIFATDPSPAATSGDGVAQQRIDAVNESKATARKAILPLIPGVECHKGN